jgi:hypothetical protein
VKHVHKALQLRHHKHTGKIIPHKHTSYGVLFVLMIIPIIALALASHFVAASEYEISASVPAIPPSTPPTIDYPTENVPINQTETTVSGSCPIATPAVVVAIYDGDELIGSTQCTSDGTYELQVMLSEGTHQLSARVVSITGESGGSSPVLTVVVRQLAAPESGGVGEAFTPVANVESLSVPLRIIPKTIFATLNGNNEASWTGTFQGGKLPYKVTVDWGDGTISTFDVNDNSEQTFTHKYSVPGAYPITISLSDASGATTGLQSTAVTFMLQQPSILDTRYEQASPIIVFIQANLLQIYIVSLSGLTFLWYLEHGRSITWQLLGAGSIFGARRKAHSGRRHR